MTEQRDLKRLVRERMARTGESYSTARRQVTAHNAKETGHHRLSVLVARFLDGAGIVAPQTGEPFSEAMVCGLAGGIGFMYAVFEYKGRAPTVTIVAQHHPDPWAPAALRRAGVSFAEGHSGSAKPAVTALRRELDAGRAALCTVARGRLPWYPEDGFDADPFPVLVAPGRSEAEVLVDDGGSPGRSVPLETFVEAWGAHRKGRHHRITLTGERSGEVAVRDAIATTVAHLTGPVLGNAFDVNFGLSGMVRFAEQLGDERGRTGWLRRFADPTALAAGLGRVHECLERELTSPGATRPLYATFLEEVGHPEAADAYRIAGERWSALAAEAAGDRGRAGQHPSYIDFATTALRRLSALAHDVVAAEREAVGVIVRV